MAIPQSHNKSETELNDRDEWRTPPELFEWLNNYFNFDVDLAANRENALCKKFFDDALIMNWHRHGECGFCNPPFSMKEEFVAKAVAEAGMGFSTTMLLPFTPETKMWRQYFCEDGNKYSVFHNLVPRYQQMILYPRVNYIGSGNGCPFVTCVIQISNEQEAGVRWATWK